MTVVRQVGETAQGCGQVGGEAGDRRREDWAAGGREGRESGGGGCGGSEEKNWLYTILKTLTLV
jgi:hypothetical protein